MYCMYVVSSSVHSYSSFGAPSLRSLSHSLRSFINSLRNSAPHCFAGQVLRRGRRGRFLWGLAPYWFIERSSRRWGAVPPVLRRSILTAGAPGSFLWGLAPYWFIERSYRRWGAVPPADPPRQSHETTI
jgi:hypothetical protein